MSGTATPNLLAAILAGTRRRVLDSRAVTSDAALETIAARWQPRGDLFREALGRRDRVNVIAECKRRSPSRGVLRADYDPVALAVAYQSAGACACSVLTEPTFFDGSLDHLAAVRRAVDLPLLRKDFILDERQLLEARACGADAVLLIVAALTDDELIYLHRRAEGLGLAALLEVHDAEEVSRALNAGARIIGVNNRNLRTLAVNAAASENAAHLIPPDVVAVSESGLGGAQDLARMRALGYRAFLVGERLVTASDPGAALRQLLDESDHAVQRQTQ